MSRDYKHAGRGARAGASLTGWLGFAAGLALGLTVALAVYLDTARIRGTADPEPAPAPAPALRPAPEPGAPAAAAPEPRFDFYTILPEMEVKVPDWQLAEPGRKPPAGAEPVDAGAYVIQVGSYQRFEDADRAKAELALLGIAANIERVVINGDEVWYRVRIGPIRELDQLHAMRARLIDAGKDFMLLRIRDGDA